MKKILFLLLVLLSALISEDQTTNTNKKACIKAGKDFQIYRHTAKVAFDEKKFSTSHLNFVMAHGSLLMWKEMKCNSFLKTKEKIEKANLKDENMLKKVSKLVEISKNLEENQNSNKM